MKIFFTFIINSLYVLVILFVAILLSFVALSHKEQIAAIDSSQPIVGTVVKQEVPVLSTITGSVHKMKLMVGQQVQQNDSLVELNASPSASPKSQTDTTGIQTITSPTQGVIEKIFVKEGYSVSPDSPLVTLLSNDNVSISVSLSDDQYQRLAKLTKVTFYSPRLDQSFVAVPGVVNPSVDDSTITNGMITVSYTFVNPHAAISLLQGEHMQVLLPDQPTGTLFSLTQLRSFLHL